MLYQLYNRLIGAFSLDKDINVNRKLLKLKKEDYKPNLLDDNEIFKYIKLMISSMNRSTSDQLLRETIAYSNMITRVYLKNKINLKYEPYSTFKELKDIMEKNEEKIEKLRNDVKEYEEKLKIMTAENKKLNKIINYFHQEKNKNIEMKQNTLSLNYRNSLKFRKLIKDRQSKEFSSSKQRSSSINYQNQRYRLNSAKLPIKNNFLRRTKFSTDEINLKSANSLSNNNKVTKKESTILDINKGGNYIKICRLKEIYDFKIFVENNIVNDLSDKAWWKDSKILIDTLSYKYNKKEKDFLNINSYKFNEVLIDVSANKADGSLDQILPEELSKKKNINNPLEDMNTPEGENIKNNQINTNLN